MDLLPGAIEKDIARPVEWTRGPLEGDEPFVPDGKSCFLCSRGGDEKNPAVAKINEALAMRGTMCDSERFEIAGKIQSTLDTSGKLEPLACAREMYKHTKQHTIETTEISAENIQTLRLLIQTLRQQVLLRNPDNPDETKVDDKIMHLIMRAMHMQSELLKLKPEGLPFTNKRRR
jgi:hypothetical protein